VAWSTAVTGVANAPAASIEVGCSDRLPIRLLARSLARELESLPVSLRALRELLFMTIAERERKRERERESESLTIET